MTVFAGRLTDRDRFLQISVNGGPATSVFCGAPCSATVQLAARTNSIKLFNSVSIAPELDGITIDLAS